MPPKRLALFDSFSDENAQIVETIQTPRKKVASSGRRTTRHKATQFELFEGDPLALPACDAETLHALGNPVPNIFPTVAMPYKIAIIGEAPGEEEEKQGIPFVGNSGYFLDQVLSKSGIARSACFIGNVTQYRPPKNDIKAFPLEGTEIQEGLAKLRSDLAQFQPNICLLLGKTALWAAKNVFNISNWRGSLFTSQSLIPGRDVKCIATYHPAYCLRQYDWTPIVMLDARKCAQEALKPELVLPQRELIINLPFYDLTQALDKIIHDKPTVSCDIEGGVHSMSCLSLAVNSSHSILVPFETLDRGHYWEHEWQEVEVWSRVARVLADPKIRKVWQNGLYDRFVTQYSYGIVTKFSGDDTMLKWWEYNCELEKNLGFQCSILTKEPFYKFERKTESQDVFYQYCCKDSAVTFEINEKLEKMLDPGMRQHYEFNNLLLNPLLYMELRGLKYNHELAKSRLADMKNHVYRAQNNLDLQAERDGAITRIDFGQPKENILSQIQDICCYVRDQTKPKADFVKRGYHPMVSLLQSSETLSDELMGQIAMVTKTTMNTKSPKFKEYLYDNLGLPVQWKKDPETKEMKRTTDYEALLKLSKSTNHPALKVSLELSRLRTRAQMLSIMPVNGRMHCNYNEVGSETGRVTCSRSNIFVWSEDAQKTMRAGAQMQTIPDDWTVFAQDEDSGEEANPLEQGMRDLMLADEGCYLGKCDLKGADGWTVGSYLAMLGDPTMLDDLKFGLKPAQIVAYILKHGADSVRGKSRPKLKEMMREIKKDDWEYFVSKQGIWGTCYTMGARKLTERVFIESEGAVNMSEKEGKDFQACIFVRYNIHLLHRYFQREIDASQYPFKLRASNGFSRTFFGRKKEILGEVLAHLPQVYTTYATNLAVAACWRDPENRIRISDTACKLRIEPMHQVHDEFLVQWRIDDTAWALNKMKQYFNNPITIANQSIVIPFDGAYGINWSMDETAKVGNI